MTRATPRPPGPGDLDEYYERMLEALRALSRQFDQVTDDERSPFKGWDRKSFDEALEELRDELDQQVVLMLAASAEAMIRTDLVARIDDPVKVRLNERFRILAKRYDKPHLVGFEEILDVWKEESKAVDEVGSLKQLYRRRHWLAHGRYYEDKSGVQLRRGQAKQCIDDFRTAVRSIAPDFPRSS